MTIIRRRVQSRPIRLFLIGMLAVPLASLLALWGFAASITVSAALTDADYSSNTQATNAGVYLLISELPQERQETYLWLLSGRRSPRAPLLGTRAQVDKALPPAKAALLAGQGSNTSVLNALITDLNGIDAIRGSVDFRRDDPVGRLPGVQRNHRRRVPLLPHRFRPAGQRIAGRHLGRRR